MCIRDRRNADAGHEQEFQELCESWQIAHAGIHPVIPDKERVWEKIMSNLNLVKPVKMYTRRLLYQAAVSYTHLVDPPSFEPEYLRKIASDMYATLTAADPKAQWMQMTWMFYFDKDKWTSERMKALLTGVPQNKMILLDYHLSLIHICWQVKEQDTPM